MLKTDRSSYTALDFQEWQNASTLVISPKFQRRSVWSPGAKSFFIDTLIREFPCPPMYLRVRQSDDGRRPVREVVDGQQRIRAILDFIAGGYRLSKSLDAPYAGRSFRELDKSDREKVQTYSFNCEVFHGASDAEVLAIFARLNTNSIPLNKQELRNGKFFGIFKQVCDGLAREYLEYWRDASIFSDRQIARMIEVEFVSELLVALAAGMQDKKKSLDNFYTRWEDEFPGRNNYSLRFKGVLAAIDDVVDKEWLRESRFCRPALFYSLFCAVAHRVYRLPGMDESTPKRSNGLSGGDRLALRERLYRLNGVLEQAAVDPESVPERMQSFVTACQRQTDNLQPRKARFKAIYAGFAGDD